MTCQSFGQNINSRLSILSDCDTSLMSTHIGEVYYFGKNMNKAKAYPQLSCMQGERRCVILWVSSKRYKKRTKLTEAQLDEYVFEMKDNGFEKYPCFAFIIDQNITRSPDSNIAIYELKFPSIIEVYKYDNNDWIKLFDKEIASHKEYGELQLDLIKKH